MRALRCGGGRNWQERISAVATRVRALGPAPAQREDRAALPTAAANCAQVDRTSAIKALYMRTYRRSDRHGKAPGDSDHGASVAGLVQDQLALPIATATIAGGLPARRAQRPSLAPTVRNQRFATRTTPYAGLWEDSPPGAACRTRPRHSPRVFRCYDAGVRRNAAGAADLSGEFPPGRVLPAEGG